MPEGKFVCFGVLVGNKKIPEYRIKDEIFTEVDLHGPHSYFIEEDGQVTNFYILTSVNASRWIILGFKSFCTIITLSWWPISLSNLLFLNIKMFRVV